MPSFHTDVPAILAFLLPLISAQWTSILPSTFYRSFHLSGTRYNTDRIYLTTLVKLHCYSLRSAGYSSSLLQRLPLPFYLHLLSLPRVWYRTEVQGSSALPVPLLMYFYSILHKINGCYRTGFFRTFIMFIVAHNDNIICKTGLLFAIIKCCIGRWYIIIYG